jgi:hypothetical protein
MSASASRCICKSVPEHRNGELVWNLPTWRADAKGPGKIFLSVELLLAQTMQRGALRLPAMHKKSASIVIPESSTVAAPSGSDRAHCGAGYLRISLSRENNACGCP